MGISLSTVNVPDWQTACASKFNCTSDGLVNVLGEPIFPTCFANGSLPADVWGISTKACQANCGSGVLRQSVDFTSSAITLTTWLLPWLALIAQLPFESNGSMNLMSACLSIGSPALAAYSIALTAFNRRYTSTTFKEIRAKAQNNSRFHYMIERIDAAAFILQETQQCPMRANQRGGELANLIILDDNNGQQKFWIAAEKDLRNTRRGFTQSFLAQVLLAFLAYLISFIAAVQESLGNPEVGLQFASSTVWSWMFPIVFGYVRVGSQCKVGTIKKALTDHKFIPSRNIAGNTELTAQIGLRPSADFPVLINTGSRDNHPSNGMTEKTAPLLPTDRRHGSTTGAQLQVHFLNTRHMGGVSPVSQEPSPTTSTLGSVQSIDRDTQSHKPSHNIPSQNPGALAGAGPELTAPLSNDLHHQYPPLTWWGFDVRGDERTEGPVFNYARILTWFTFAGHVHAGFNSAVASLQTTDMVQPLTTHDAAALCCLEQDLKAFMPFSTLRKHPQVIHHMLQAALVALFLQWGTTGAAIFVAYRTPAIGLGCRSGSYLIYGIAATVSWLMLVFSNLVSHKIMQRLETQPDTQSTRGLGRLAVITRLTGKAIAIVNAGWLIASSVMEDIGAFQNCWCQTDAFQFHEHGWTAVFKSASDLRNAAGGIWIGGFIWSMAVCIVVAVVFAYQVNGERNTLD